MTFALIIPTLNASKEIPILFDAIAKQVLQPDQILVIDSSSTDNTMELLANFSVKTHVIPANTFDHGGTRQLATQLVDADIYLFLTQDAIPAHPECFQNLIHALLPATVGCVYGRQLPQPNANPLSTHARLFNYPAETQIRTYADKIKYGVKTYFTSNSFAAYKKGTLQSIGGFPSRLMAGEDAYVAGKMLLQGYTVCYAATACVYHSHNLNLVAEFHRYFSIGIAHRQANWLIKEFGSAHSEGLRFVRSELRFLFKNKKIHWLPRMIASTFVKFFGYKLGMHEKKIPYFLKKNWGINRSYW